MTTPAPQPFDIPGKLQQLAQTSPGADFAIRFDANGLELGWSNPSDWYDRYGRAPNTAYVIKYDATGHPFEVISYSPDCDAADICKFLQLAPDSSANDAMPAQSQEDPKDRVRPDIWAITRGFCR